jgi:hypothetical protein
VSVTAARDLVGHRPGRLTNPRDRSTAPFLHEQPGVAVRAPLTLIMDRVAIGEQRTVVLIKCWHRAERQIMHQHRDRVRRIVRTTPEVHDIRTRYDVLDSLPSGRTMRDEPAVPRTRVHGKGGLGVARDLTDEIERRAPADRAEPLARRDRSLDHADVLTPMVLHRLDAWASACSPEPAMISSW